MSTGVWLIAQTPSTQRQPAPTFRAGIDLVQLDVSVLDRNRRPIKGLTAADFTVLENGRPQAISAFDEIDIPDSVEPSAAWVRDVAADVVTNDLNLRRVVVIVFDDAHLPYEPDIVNRAKEIGRAVVGQLGPDDLAAVTFTLIGQRQDITSDRGRLLASIKSLVPHPDFERPLAQWPMSAARNPSAGAGGRMGMPPCAYRGRTRGIGACVVDTLVTAANALADAPLGRKTLVYISAGVPFDFSMENLDVSDDISGIQQLLRSLQQGNVNIYAFDPTGLSADGIMAPRLDTLRIFAENTGGRATIATNAPVEQVPQVFRENSSYYLLGFRSTNPTADGRFRKLEVKVNRRDAEVRSRSGYYAPRPTTSSKAPVAARSATEKALGNALPGGDLKFSSTIAPFFVPGQREAALALAVGLRQPLADRPSHEALKLTAAAIDGDGKERAGSREEFALTLPAGAQREIRYDVLSKIMVRPGRYQVRVAMEQQSLAGTVFIDVDVPDFARAPFSASGLIISVDPPLPGPPTDRIAGLTPIKPTTLREFRLPQRVTAFVRLYQGGSKALEPVRVNAVVVDEANRTKFDNTTFFESARFGVGRSADYQIELPISKLEAGPHLLTIDATMGRTSLRRTAKFVIR